MWLRHALESDSEFTPQGDLADAALAILTSEQVSKYRDTIVARLQSQDAATRLAALETLCKLRPEVYAEYAEQLSHLVHADSELRCAALVALNELQSGQLEKYATVLVRRVADASAPVRDAARKVVDRLRLADTESNARAIKELLLTEAGDDERGDDGSVQSAALTLLGRFQPALIARHVDVIAEQQSHSVQAVKLAARSTLSQLGPELLVAVALDKLSGTVQASGETFKPTFDLAQLSIFGRRLSLEGQSSWLDITLSSLTSQQALTQKDAILAKLKSQDVGRQQAALAIICRLQSTACIAVCDIAASDDIVKHGLAHTDGFIRFLALKALGKLPPHSLLRHADKLVERLGDDEPAVRCMALDTLSMLQHSDIIEHHLFVVAQLVGNENDSVREAVIGFLRKLRPGLVAAATAAAAHAAASFADEVAAAATARARAQGADSRAQGARAAARAAATLAKQTAKILPLEPLVNAILGHLRHDDRPAVQCTALDALATLPDFFSVEDGDLTSLLKREVRPPACSIWDARDAQEALLAFEAAEADFQLHHALRCSQHAGEIVQLVGHGNTKVRDAAIVILRKRAPDFARLPPEALTQHIGTIVALLSKLAPLVCCSALEALKSLDFETISSHADTVLERLNHLYDDDPAVRSAALSLLGRLNPTQLGKHAVTIARRLGDKDATVHEEAISLLTLLPVHCLAEHAHAVAEHLCDEASAVRCAALKLLRRLKPSQLLQHPRIFWMIADGDAAAREVAMATLSQLTSELLESYSHILGEHLNNKDAAVRYAALTLFSKFEQVLPQHTLSIIRMLADDNAAARELAVFILKKIPPGFFRGSLEGALVAHLSLVGEAGVDSEDEAVRLVALDLLDKLSPEWCAQNAVTVVRIAIEIAPSAVDCLLARLRESTSLLDVDAIAEHLSSSTPAVREAALRVLSKLQLLPHHAVRIAQKVADPDAAVREAVIKVLPTDFLQSRASSVIEHLSNEDRAVRCTALNLLTSRLEPPQLVQHAVVMIPILFDRDTEVRGAAQRWLTQLASLPATEPMRSHAGTIAKYLDNLPMRSAALSALSCLRPELLGDHVHSIVRLAEGESDATVQAGDLLTNRLMLLPLQKIFAFLEHDASEVRQWATRAITVLGPRVLEQRSELTDFSYYLKHANPRVSCAALEIFCHLPMSAVHAWQREWVGMELAAQLAERKQDVLQCAALKTLSALPPESLAPYAPLVANLLNAEEPTVLCDALVTLGKLHPDVLSVHAAAIAQCLSRKETTVRLAVLQALRKLPHKILATYADNISLLSCAEVGSSEVGTSAAAAAGSNTESSFLAPLVCLEGTMPAGVSLNARSSLGVYELQLSSQPGTFVKRGDPTHSTHKNSEGSWCFVSRGECSEPIEQVVAEGWGRVLSPEHVPASRWNVLSNGSRVPAPDLRCVTCVALWPPDQAVSPRDAEPDATGLTVRTTALRILGTVAPELIVRYSETMSRLISCLKSEEVMVRSLASAVFCNWGAAKLPVDKAIALAGNLTHTDPDVWRAALEALTQVCSSRKA